LPWQYFVHLLVPYVFQTDCLGKPAKKQREACQSAPHEKWGQQWQKIKNDNRCQSSQWSDLLPGRNFVPTAPGMLFWGFFFLLIISLQRSIFFCHKAFYLLQQLLRQFIGVVFFPLIGGAPFFTIKHFSAITEEHCH
jgi:hypothetical protein